MCTAINSKNNREKNLFGRTLDVVASYGEGVVITPRDFRLEMRHEGIIDKHCAMIGAAVVKDGVPLYYDATNEYGLSVAALNFPISAVYNAPCKDKYNLASYELIWWLLSKCESVDEAEKLLLHTNVTSDAFDKTLSPTPLHWMIADAKRSMVAEPMAERLMLYDNSFDVMTNEPPFDFHIKHAALYAGLDARQPDSTELYSNGMGAIGLPGDLSSPSRFVRAAFFNEHCDVRQSGIERFFEVALHVGVPYGSVIDANGKKPFTVYTSCVDTSDLTYYFTTYGNRTIRAVRLSEKEAAEKTLSVFSMSGDATPKTLN